MKLARAAATRALDAHEQAQAAPTPTPEDAPAPRTPDPNLAFARLAHSVRQTVALEAKIAADAFARPGPGQARPAEPDSQDPGRYDAILDRHNLAEAAQHLTRSDPDCWQKRETIHDIIEDTLTTFPDDPIHTHFTRVCQALDVAPDLASLPLELASQLRAPPPEHPPDRWPKP